ncbi:hypothetical protein KFK09_024382 [Dendrobium nobile]|uniref:Uncharacterized protein n=1 Tax=Dendrobium nobile TaxID=94219 RepID=A0A8T3ADL7_DENNO|nr:hypothetical protein KFK09_024382 [Dendrobium nobile]
MRQLYLTKCTMDEGVADEGRSASKPSLAMQALKPNMIKSSFLLFSSETPIENKSCF